MTKKMFLFLFIAFQSTFFAFGCNQTLLDLEAGTYHHRIWSSIDTPSSKVETSLCFLYDANAVNEKYKEEESFKKFCDQVTTQIAPNIFKQMPQKLFLSFVENCRQIHVKAKEDSDTKISVYMLLERVQEKSLDTFRRLKKLENPKRNKPELKVKECSKDDVERLMGFLLKVDPNTVMGMTVFSDSDRKGPSELKGEDQRALVGEINRFPTSSTPKSSSITVFPQLSTVSKIWDRIPFAVTLQWAKYLSPVELLHLVGVDKACQTLAMQELKLRGNTLLISTPMGKFTLPQMADEDEHQNFVHFVQISIPWKHTSLQVISYDASGTYGKFEAERELSKLNHHLTALKLHACIDRRNVSVFTVAPWTNLQSLRLHCHETMRDDGVKILAAALGRYPGLHTLELKQCKITSKGVEFLMPALAVCSQLQSLRLPYNKIKDEGLAKLFPVLRTLPLTSLDLSNNSLEGKVAVSVLSQGLEECTSLSLSTNWFKETEIKNLGMALRNWPKLEHLRLEDMGLGAQDSLALAEGVGGCVNLVSLDFSSNHGIGRGIISLLVRCTRLTSLNFTSCRIKDANFQQLVEDISRYLPHLIDLDLSSNEMEMKGAEALAHSLHSQLVTLDLDENETLEGEGVVAITANAWPHLKTLKLSRVCKGHKGLPSTQARLLIEAVQRGNFPKLTRLELGRSLYREEIKDDEVALQTMIEVAGLTSLIHFE